jgi:dephospho-CoA kinase
MPSAKNSSPSFLIGVTGGMGSGKSAVCEAFAQEGIPVLLADDIAKELCDRDSVLRKKLIGILGEESYASDGSYNRTYVASRIFADQDLKERVEACIHPRVEKEIARRVNALRSTGQHLILIEAALVFESGMDEWLDAVLVVDAEEPIRIQRVARRTGLADEEIRMRMLSQIPTDEKIQWADYVIKNNGTMEELRDRVKFFASLFRSLLQIRTV